MFENFAEVKRYKQLRWYLQKIAEFRIIDVLVKLFTHPNYFSEKRYFFRGFPRI